MRLLQFTKMNHRQNGRRLEGAPHGAQQGIVANVARPPTDFTCFRIHELNRHGLHRGIGLNGRLDQVGMKGQQIAAIAGGAFRKNGHHVAVSHGIGHVFDHAQRVFAAGAFNVQRARTRGQHADQRPVAHIRLGDKTAVPRCVDDQNVEPRNVVGHHERWPTDHRLAQHFEVNAPQRQKLQGPGLHTHFPLLW